jgi:hypothetical protein
VDENRNTFPGTARVTPDPEPPDSDLATPQEAPSYKIAVNDYAAEWIESYTGLSAVIAGLIWADFTKDTCKAALENIGET